MADIAWCPLRVHPPAALRSPLRITVDVPRNVKLPIFLEHKRRRQHTLSIFHLDIGRPLLSWLRWLLQQVSWFATDRIQLIEHGLRLDIRVGGSACLKSRGQHRTILMSCIPVAYALNPHGATSQSIDDLSCRLVPAEMRNLDLDGGTWTAVDCGRLQLGISGQQQ